MVKRLLVKKQEDLLPELTQEIPQNGIITVGNDSSATIELDDDSIAPEQFVIVCEEGSMTLLCRVDGTVVNGTALTQGALHNLQYGDVITIGEYTLIAEREGKSDSMSAEKTTETFAEPSEIQLPLSDTSKSAETPKTTTEKGERSLTDVLEGLRSEEKFYFLIKDAGHGNRRIYIETEEMWLGWSASGDCVLSVLPEEVDIPRAQIRKDWSGVVLYPLQSGYVWLNEETLTEPHRLKNDDKLFIMSKEGTKLNLETVVKFHEPTALLILDSILPKELPPPILLDDTANDIGEKEIDESDLIQTSKILQSAETLRRKRQIFGYFTITEIIIMAIGTMITAAFIFLILELY